MQFSMETEQSLKGELKDIRQEKAERERAVPVVDGVRIVGILGLRRIRKTLSNIN